MTWWTIAIYGIAGVLALQGLFSLMTVYRAAALRRILNERLQRENEQSANAAQSVATNSAA